MTVLDLSPVTVFTPAHFERTPILPASGIVGIAADDGRRVRVDYEGDRFGPTEQFKLWADRVHHAWGRHAANYPTVARALLPVEDLVAVGVYDPAEGVISVAPDRLGDVARWLGVTEPEVAAQLEISSVVRHQQRREIRAALAAGTMARTAIAAYARRHGHEDLLT